MTALEIADLLKDYGPWGLCGLFALVIVVLDRRLQACQDARIADAKVSAAAMERQTSTNTETATALNAMREGQTEVMRVVTLLQRDVENDDERLREKLEGLARVVENVCRRGAQ
ncbi:hypothetical protein [Methylobacterium oxalidis]|uniref:Uncharacterized protein n=1 Tax=Methylobacterium oxalidis TaxID=944322 RepID=A0A512J6H1_9HYPH|nr:hypothetical protein [Methylobacterium oxalidis]GEP05578.1 hypothetical protein MOX02_36160 [Methylobacterium oxalidis]GJE32695.1 hypothetical protein LDDCCGHA_2883 [Methylobacterium oxalidis]GLS65441.1 hypothetical protein GCM10007888_38230 [Methylobacterium oxalidis]